MSRRKRGQTPSDKRYEEIKRRRITIGLEPSKFAELAALTTQQDITPGELAKAIVVNGVYALKVQEAKLRRAHTASTTRQLDALRTQLQGEAIISARALEKQVRAECEAAQETQAAAIDQERAGLKAQLERETLATLKAQIDATAFVACPRHTSHHLDLRDARARAAYVTLMRGQLCTWNDALATAVP